MQFTRKIDVFVQVLCFTCPCCLSVSRVILYASGLIIFRNLFHSNFALHQWCFGCNLQHSCVWYNHPPIPRSQWQESNSSSSCLSFVSPSLVLHLSLLYWHSIASCSTCLLPYESQEELSIQCIGKRMKFIWFLLLLLFQCLKIITICF